MSDDVKNALPGYDKDEIGDPVGFFRTLFRLKDIQEMLLGTGLGRDGNRH